MTYNKTKSRFFRRGLYPYVSTFTEFGILEYLVGAEQAVDKVCSVFGRSETEESGSWISAAFLIPPLYCKGYDLLLSLFN